MVDIIVYLVLVLLINSFCCVFLPCIHLHSVQNLNLLIARRALTVTGKSYLKAIYSRVSRVSVLTDIRRSSWRRAPFWSSKDARHQLGVHAVWPCNSGTRGFNPSFAASQEYASSFKVLFASAGLNDFGLSASNIKAYVLNRHLKTLAGINFRFTCEAGVKPLLIRFH